MNLTSLLSPEDLRAMNGLINSYLKAWNDYDTDHLIEHFTDCAEYTDSLGQIAIGKSSIQRLIDFQFQITHEQAIIDFDELYLRYLQPELVICTGKWIAGASISEPVQTGLIHLICSKNDPASWKIIFAHSLDKSNPHLN